MQYHSDRRCTRPDAGLTDQPLPLRHLLFIYVSTHLISNSAHGLVPYGRSASTQANIDCRTVVYYPLSIGLTTPSMQPSIFSIILGAFFAFHAQLTLSSPLPEQLTTSTLSSAIHTNPDTLKPSPVHALPDKSDHKTHPPLPYSIIRPKPLVEAPADILPREKAPTSLDALSIPNQSDGTGSQQIDCENDATTCGWCSINPKTSKHDCTMDQDPIGVPKGE